jgi:5-methylcytosine-specific restriction endonuclease McrA
MIDGMDADRLAGYLDRGLSFEAIARLEGLGRGYYRCGRCRGDRVSERRRRLKEVLVAEAGGRCQLCGYDRSVAALEFHHVDPATKAFGLAVGGLTRGLAACREEAAKCVLLCSNCHAEVEAGVQALS